MSAYAGLAVNTLLTLIRRCKEKIVRNRLPKGEIVLFWRSEAPSTRNPLARHWGVSNGNIEYNKYSPIIVIYSSNCGVCVPSSSLWQAGWLLASGRHPTCGWVINIQCQCIIPNKLKKLSNNKNCSHCLLNTRQDIYFQKTMLAPSPQGNLPRDPCESPSAEGAQPLCHQALASLPPIKCFQGADVGECGRHLGAWQRQRRPWALLGASTRQVPSRTPRGTSRCH